MCVFPEGSDRSLQQTCLTPAIMCNIYINYGNNRIYIFLGCSSWKTFNSDVVVWANHITNQRLGSLGLGETLNGHCTERYIVCYIISQ